MSKNLTVTYDGVTLFDGNVDELQWQDLSSEGAVSVVGKQRRQPAASGLGELLTRARKQQADRVVPGELDA